MKRLSACILLFVSAWACAPDGGEEAPAPGAGTEDAVELAATQDPLIEQARALFEVIPGTPPELEGNPATPEKVELGKMLYLSLIHI